MDSPYTIFIISALAFFAIMAVIEGIYLIWRDVDIPSRIKLHKRVNHLFAGGAGRNQALSLLRKEHYSSSNVLNTIYKHMPRLVALHRLIEQANVSVTVTRVLLLQLSLGIIFSALLIFFSKLNIYILIFAGLAAGFFLPVSFLTRKKSLRRDQLAEQLPDALDYIARSLRAGNPFSTSIKLISKEMGGPIAYEFGIVFDEINFGLDVEEALHGLFERTQSEDIRYFVTAVILQKTTGGNLAEVLNRIAGIIRDRARMKNEIGILSSEMRLSANIFILLPFIVAGAILFLNPDYMKPLFEHELGLKIIGLQILMMVCGYAIIQKMVRFHF